MAETYTVYILVRETDKTRHYTGCTKNLKDRIYRPNSGDVSHTAKYRPWACEVAIEFNSQTKSRAFEKYLKSGSGREFARRHF